MTGQMVYADAYSLLARPFDVRRRTFTGGAVPIADSVVRSSARTTGAAGFGISSRSLVYIPGSGSFRRRKPTSSSAHRSHRAIRTSEVAARTLSTPRCSPEMAPVGLRVRTATGPPSSTTVERDGLRHLRFRATTGPHLVTDKRLTSMSDREGILPLSHIVRGPRRSVSTTPNPETRTNRGLVPRSTRCLSVTGSATSRCGPARAGETRSAVWQRALDLPNWRRFSARRTVGRLLVSEEDRARFTSQRTRNSQRRKRARAPHQR